jgi:hypothetical protein
MAGVPPNPLPRLIDGFFLGHYQPIRQFIDARLGPGARARARHAFPANLCPRSRCARCTRIPRDSRVWERSQWGDVMAKSSPTWLGAALVAIGAFLAACSHDPITPAPVVMMGGNGATDARAAAIPGPQPAAGAAEPRHAQAAPVPPVARAAQTQHPSRRSVATGNHPTRAQKKARARLATTHVAAPRRQAKTYPVAREATTPTTRAGAISLDDPVGSPAGPAALPPAGTTPSERTTSSWVLPPAEPPHSEFRAPVR